MTKLKEIEKKISSYLVTDRRTWAETYILMQEVRDKKMYEEEYASFTQWVNQLADRNHYHQSTLWARFKAGSVYSEYAERKKAEGKKVKSIKEVDISPDTIALVGTIAGRSKNTQYTDELMDKALKHQMSRQDLRDINREIRLKKDKKSQKSTDKEATNLDSTEKTTKTELEAIKVEKTKVTAKMIISSLKSQTSWLDATHMHRRMDFYKVWPELPVHSGTSRHARRMDACVLENLTHDHAYSDSVSIHTIEIKVAKNDLIHDRKMGEYAEYGDYFWLAVADNLTEIAKKYIAKSWGILAITENGKITVIKKAIKRNCLFREKTLTEAITHS